MHERQRLVSFESLHRHTGVCKNIEKRTKRESGLYAHAFAWKARHAGKVDLFPELGLAVAHRYKN